MIKAVRLPKDFTAAEVEGKLARSVMESPELAEKVRLIVARVRRDGDRALLELTRELDGVNLTTETIRVPREQFENAYGDVDDSFLTAIRRAKQRISAFHEKQLENSWFMAEKQSFAGQLVRPIGRVGIYVPGGRAAYPSTVLMNALPARIAGVEDIAICVPGPLKPEVLVAAAEVGVKEVYRLGGAQAVAALAYGTETVRKVDKITGPGNVYVTLAKKLVVGDVGIDMLAGPSEIVIVADSEAEPDFVASDMLAQAEHDPEATAILITSSEHLADAVNDSLAKQIGELSREETARESLKEKGRILLVEDIQAALKAANIIGPEHLELLVEAPMSYLGYVENAGAVFLGAYTPEALGDYLAGPNHTLPTGGTARFCSPLGVYDFIKRPSVLNFSKESLEDLGESVAAIADSEGFDGHAKSVKRRLEERDQTQN